MTRLISIRPSTIQRPHLLYSISIQYSSYTRPPNEPLRPCSMLETLFQQSQLSYSVLLAVFVGLVGLGIAASLGGMFSSRKLDVQGKVCMILSRLPIPIQRRLYYTKQSVRYDLLIEPALLCHWRLVRSRSSRGYRARQAGRSRYDCCKRSEALGRGRG